MLLGTFKIMSLTLESNNVAMGILLLENENATFEDFQRRAVHKLSKKWKKKEE